MKPCLPKLRKHLEENNVKIRIVTYFGQGRKPLWKGFDAWNKKGKIEVEPKGEGEYFVTFKKYGNGAYINDKHFWNHFSVKRKGFQPILTQHISELKKEIDKLFEI